MLRQPALEPAEEGPAKGRPIAARREARCLMLSVDCTFLCLAHPSSTTLPRCAKTMNSCDMS